MLPRWFFLQVISCDSNVCTLQITDTAGSHQFPAMQRLSITRGHAFILIYSISSMASLEELRPIYLLIKEIKGAETMPSVPIMLVGNKSDETHREVSWELGKQTRQDLFSPSGARSQCCWLEASATWKNDLVGLVWQGPVHPARLSDPFRILKLSVFSPQVKAEAAAHLAKSWGCGFIEISAKTNHNITELFQELLQMEKKRKMSLNLGDKKNKTSDKLKGKCVIT